MVPIGSVCVCAPASRYSIEFFQLFNMGTESQKPRCLRVNPALNQTRTIRTRLLIWGPPHKMSAHFPAGNAECYSPRAPIKSSQGAEGAAEVSELLPGRMARSPTDVVANSASWPFDLCHGFQGQATGRCCHWWSPCLFRLLYRVDWGSTRFKKTTFPSIPSLYHKLS